MVCNIRVWSKQKCQVSLVVNNFIQQDINHLYTNGFDRLVWYNKLGMVHCTFLVESGYNFMKISFYQTLMKCFIIMLHIIWVCTVCKRLWASRLQKVKHLHESFETSLIIIIFSDKSFKILTTSFLRKDVSTASCWVSSWGVESPMSPLQWSEIAGVTGLISIVATWHSPYPGWVSCKILISLSSWPADTINAPRSLDISCIFPEQDWPKCPWLSNRTHWSSWLNRPYEKSPTVTRNPLVLSSFCIKWMHS